MTLEKSFRIIKLRFEIIFEPVNFYQGSTDLMVILFFRGRFSSSVLNAGCSHLRPGNNTKLRN